MNIAYFSHYFSPEIGAPSARIHDLSRSWMRGGHNVDVVTCFPNHPEGKIYQGYKRSIYFYENIDGINVHRNWTYITANRGFIKKTIGHISFWLSSKIFSTKHLSGLDVVIGTSPTLFAAMAARGLARSKNIPFVMEVRDLWPGIFVDLGIITNKLIIHLLEAWELWMYRESQLIITVTESFRENIIRRGVDEKKVHVVPNGADVEFWQPIEFTHDLAEELGMVGKFVVLYIGAHGVSQALAAILESARLLKGNEDIVFLFVGAGSEKEKLVDLAQQGKLSNVVFRDPVTKQQVKEFYSIADVCLVPLRDIELFSTFIPSKMFEILAMERPIIASIKGEAEMVLKKSGGAIVTPPEDSQAIADAILDLYQNPERRREMGQRGREYVFQNYSREKLASDYVSILNDLLNEKWS